MANDDYPSNEIGDLPNVANFGSEFSYAAWTPGTTVTLCNVPWNSDYRDVAYFANTAALNAYLNTSNRSGPRITVEKMTYCRMGMPIRLNVPFAAAMNYNYLRVVNSAQPVQSHNSAGQVGASENGSQTLYYFVTEVRYLAPNTTELWVQLDVWQTYGRSMRFGNCYIERGHIGIANENNFANNGRDYLTIPEGLDIGNEYVIAKTYEHVYLDNHDDDTDMGVMVLSTTSLQEPYGTVDAPILRTAKGSNYAGVPNGCDIYIWSSPEHYIDFMRDMADKPWVTQGIVSVTAVSYTAAMGPSVVTDTSAAGPVRLVSGGGDGDVYKFVLPEFDAAEIRDRRWLAQNWRNGLLTGRYANLKKFLTYPYTAVEMTTYSATPIVLKPECMAGDDIVVLQKSFLGQPNPRIVWIPYKYNAKVNAPIVYDANGAIVNDGGEMFDLMTGIFDLPTFSVVNDGYLSYMASNKNGIAYQHSSADWSQQRALSGAAASASNTARDIQLGQDLAGQSLRSLVDSSNLSRSVMGQRALLGGANDVVGGIAGGPAGAASAIGNILNRSADLTISQNQLEGSTAISSAQNQNSARMTANTGIQNNDTNYQYARYAAQGDYQNAIAGINAKVQDAKLIQPTTSGQLGGDVFNLAMFKWGLFAKVKTLQPAVMAAIGEYWLRYGYAINRFGSMPDDFQVMNKFTYWKLRETYIQVGTCPETFRQTVRGIFEKGVTVWSNADDIGMIDIATNTPKNGITL